MAEGKTNTLASSGAVRAESSGTTPADSSLGSAPTMDDRPSSIPGPGALIDNKYRVDDLIARGGMGVVYAAKNMATGKRVALKWMLPALGQIKGARDRFMQEASATARIAHPNIVDIYDVGSEQGSAYLVMEYLHGETLADRICRQRLLVQDAIALLMPALRGVAAAHRHGVIHRDLKPENIFLCCTEHGDELEPKVLDFGISKITSDEVRNLALTHSGAVLGTPYYMSPEQVRGSRDVDHRADVYAIGVILFEALTGERPYDAETYNELILKIATEPLPSIVALSPDLDPRLIAIVERAMARDPKQRFDDIKQLALALEPFSGGVRFRSMQTLNPHEKNSGDFGLPPAAPELNASAAPIAKPEAAPAQVQRGTRLAIVATFASLVACAAVAVYFLNHPEIPALQPQAPEEHEHAAVGGTPNPRPVDDKSAITALEAAAQAEPSAAPSVPQPAAAQAPPPLAATPTPNAALSGSVIELPGVPGMGKLPSKHSARTPKLSVATQPEPVPQAAPTPVVVRSLPNDWDRRLDQPAAPATAIHMPAGHINMNDFR